MTMVEIDQHDPRRDFCRAIETRKAPEKVLLPPFSVDCAKLQSRLDQ